MKKIDLLILIIIILTFQYNLICEWKQIVGSDFGDVQSINCPDSNNCFALVNHPSTPVLYKSIDQGNTWQLIYEDSIRRNPSVEEGVSPHANYYFIIDDTYAIIKKSSDGGLNFKEIQLEPGYYHIYHFSMYDTSYGFITSRYNFYTTTNGWETFERHPKLHTNQTYYSPIFLDTNTVGMIYSSPWANGMGLGVSYIKYYIDEDIWDTVSYFGKKPGVGVDYIYGIYFVNDTLGFACGRQSDTSLPNSNYFDLLYRTTNGGNNWYVIHKVYVYPQIGFINNIAFADENNGIAVGFYGKIAMTNDGGDTWVYEPTPNAMDNARKMLVCWAGRTPLIGTWDAGIFRYEGDFFKFPVGVVDREITNYELRITPNPAREYIEINFGADGGRGSGVGGREIQIYNVYGECVTNLTLDKKNTPLTPLERGIGNGERIDVSALSPGIYFVKITLNGFDYQVIPIIKI
ncbi:MAG: T9SS type A sorting domain-containing protein [bacterium]